MAIDKSKCQVSVFNCNKGHIFYVQDFTFIQLYYFTISQIKKKLIWSKSIFFPFEVVVEV